MLYDDSPQEMKYNRNLYYGNRNLYSDYHDTNGDNCNVKNDIQYLHDENHDTYDHDNEKLMAQIDMMIALLRMMITGHESW